MVKTYIQSLLKKPQKRVVSDQMRFGSGKQVGVTLFLHIYSYWFFNNLDFLYNPHILIPT